MSLDFVFSILPVIAGSVSTYLTEVVKDVVESGGAKVPAKLKGVFNILFSAVLAGLSSVVFPVDLPTAVGLGAAAGLASSSGFKVGKKS